ncbi:unnamed protein product [Camellia sinensis]
MTTVNRPSTSPASFFNWSLCFSLLHSEIPKSKSIYIHIHVYVYIYNREEKEIVKEHRVQVISFSQVDSSLSSSISGLYVSLYTHHGLNTNYGCLAFSSDYVFDSAIWILF